MNKLTEQALPDNTFTPRIFTGNDNYGKPKSEYVERLKGMSNDELEKETESKIWLSAFASNNRHSDYHWHVEACYDDCRRRGDMTIYNRAYHKAAQQ